MDAETANTTIMVLLVIDIAIGIFTIFQNIYNSEEK